MTLSKDWNESAEKAKSISAERIYKKIRNKVSHSSMNDLVYLMWSYANYFYLGKSIPDDIPFPRDIIPITKYRLQLQETKLKLGIFPSELDLFSIFVLHYGGESIDKTLLARTRFVDTMNFIKALADKSTEMEGVEINSAFWRIAQMQFPIQVINFLDIVSRYYKLYSDKKLRELLEKHFNKKYRFEKILIVGLSLTGYFLSKYSFKTDSIETTIKDLEQEDLELFLSMYSSSGEKMLQKFNISNRYTENFAYLISPLIAYPLLKYRDKTYCPIPQYLLDRITVGLRYDLLKEDVGEVNNAFGLAFEHYIKDLTVSNSESLMLDFPDEDYYVGKKRKDKIDGIIEDDSAIIFMECKSGYISSLSSRTEKLGYKETSKKIADDIIQAYRTLIDYKANKYPHRKYNNNKKKFLYLLTLDEVFVIPDFGGTSMLKLINDAIWEKIPKKITEEFPWYLCSSRVYEQVLQLLEPADYQIFNFMEEEETTISSGVISTPIKKYKPLSQMVGLKEEVITQVINIYRGREKPI